MISTSLFTELYERAEKDSVALRIGVIIDLRGEVLLLERDDSGPVKAILKLPGTTVEPREPLDAAPTRGCHRRDGPARNPNPMPRRAFRLSLPVGKPVRRLHFAVDVAATFSIRLSAHTAYPGHRWAATSA